MADELNKYRQSSFGAEETLFFLNVPTSQEAPETKAFHMAFLRQEADTIDTGVETETVPDVTQKVQPTEIKSYSPTQAFSGLFLKEDPVCLALEKVWRDRATGADAHFDHLEVDTWNANKAYKTDVTVSVSSITNEAGDKRKIEGSFGFASDSIEGTATIDADTGVATFKAGGAG